MAREEEEKPKAFKVEDRRRFSAEGELKPDQPPESSRAASESSGPQSDVEAPRPTNTPNFTAGAPRPDLAQAPGQLSFATFVVGLSTQALVHLGEIPEPQTGKVEGDLRAAEQVIDIIGMLRDKTRGNLEADEAQLVDTILFELRMKYVERARQVPH